MNWPRKATGRWQWATLDAVSALANRRLSTVSQMFLPHGNEFHRQEHVPPVGVESIDPAVVFMQQMDDDEGEESGSRVNDDRRLSTISQLYKPMNDEEDEKETRPRGRERTLLFIVQPLLTACLLFPIGSLFWQCGWNLVLIFLNVLNRYPLNLHLEDIPLADDEQDEQQRPYSWPSLFVPYLVSQLFLLSYYLCQNLVYDCLKRQPWLLTGILLKVYIFILATVYIVQWETMWSVWDEFAPTEWYFDFTLSVCSLLALIVTVGHSSDLVCSPFIVTYDSLDSCVHLGSPLLTREVSRSPSHFTPSYSLCLFR
jgi:Fuseless